MTVALMKNQIQLCLLFLKESSVTLNTSSNTNYENLPWNLHHIHLQVIISLEQAHVLGVLHHQIQAPQAADTQQPVNQILSPVVQAMTKVALFSDVMQY